MIVCVCHRVSDRDIAHEARSGCSSFEELQDELRVATACGACLDCAQATFSQHRAGAQGACHAWPAGQGAERAPTPVRVIAMPQSQRHRPPEGPMTTPTPTQHTTALLSGARLSSADAPASSHGSDRRRLYSEQLFGLAQEVEIAHGDAVYRLRRTSLGKLILTK